MGYITRAELKSYKAINIGGDDYLLDTLILAAQRMIEDYTGRVFEASADTTRTLDVARMVEGSTLYLDKDLCAITTVTNNADGTAEVLTSSHYTTLPRNETPYYALKLLTSTGKYWRYTSNSENGITIAGKWAYSTTPPAVIKQACTRLAAYFYQQRDAQVFDVTADLGSGQLIIPKGLPQDVKVMLDPYRRSI